GADRDDRIAYEGHDPGGGVDRLIRTRPTEQVEVNPETGLGAAEVNGAPPDEIGGEDHVPSNLSLHPGCHLEGIAGSQITDKDPLTRRTESLFGDINPADREVLAIPQPGA